MRALLLACGGLVVVAALTISVVLNCLFGMSLGQTETKQYLFGGVSVVADLWKALGPIFVQPLWLHRRILAAAAGSVAWGVCAVYAMSCALGVAAQDRGALTGGRETTRAKYELVTGELRRTEERRQHLNSTLTVAELEAAVASVLARPIRSQERVRGTVDSLSERCTKVENRTVDACAEVAALRQDLALSIEAREADRRIAELRRQISELRDRGATLSVDAQAELMSSLTRGWISVGDLRQGLVVLLVAVLELVSAFGPVVLGSYAHATRDVGRVAVSRDRARSDGTGRAMSRSKTATETVIQDIGTVLNFLAERVEPSTAPNGIAVEDLIVAYEQWCITHRYQALTRESFIEDLDAARQAHGLETKIRKFGTRYFGLRLTGTAGTALAVGKSD